MGKTELVPAGYVVNKSGLGGVGVGPQQNRNSQMENDSFGVVRRAFRDPITDFYIFCYARLHRNHVFFAKPMNLLRRKGQKKWGEIPQKIAFLRPYF